MFSLFVFDIVFVLKCKSENGNGVIPTDPDRFQPYEGQYPIQKILMVEDCDGTPCDISLLSIFVTAD